MNKLHCVRRECCDQEDYSKGCLYGWHETESYVSWVSCAVSDAVGACGSGSPRKETAVLVGWRRRSDNHVLVRMKAEAVLHASRGVDVGVIAGMVERAERTVQEWPAEWRATRMRRVPAGHAGNEPVNVFV